MKKKDDAYFMRRAIELSKEALSGDNGGPFGCVIVKDEKIIGEGNNLVIASFFNTLYIRYVNMRTKT